MPTVRPEDLDENHGVAGRDAADFISMQKNKKKRQAVAIFCLWVVLLAVAAFMGWTIQNDRGDRREKNQVVDRELIERRKIAENAQQECQKTLSLFLNVQQNYQKLEHIVGGDQYASALPLYYKDSVSMTQFRLGRARIQAMELKKVGDTWMSRSIFEHAYEVEDEGTGVKTQKKETFEAVFWKDGDKWLLDWPQFVRLYETKWDNYMKAKNPDRVYRYRLYIRRLSVSHSADHKYDEFVMYPAKNQVNHPSGEPVSVFVAKGKNIRGILLKHIKESEKKDPENPTIMDRIDPVNLARVDVGLTFAEVGGKLEPVIDKLYGIDWMTPPASSKKDAGSSSTEADK
eukprot:Seg14601.2 transcript_id=Seg14601.2/GoldUCD/mRNA.D3Y31 product="hypothetical protein" protein_id=Seg14601.2/GoldUCD/D3Y31